MKTKFILHGGMLKYKNKHNDSFFKEFTKDLQNGDEILHIGFARRDVKDQWRTFERDKELILAQTGKNVTVTNATHENLMEEAKRSKAFFVTGGDSRKLLKNIKQHPNLFEAIKGKVYAGSSAGACIISAYYFGCTPARVLQGLGWLPIRLMVHYGNPEYNATDETLEQLKQYPDDSGLVVLKECEWRVFEL